MNDKLDRDRTVAGRPLVVWEPGTGLPEDLDSVAVHIAGSYDTPLKEETITAFGRLPEVGRVSALSTGTMEDPYDTWQLDEAIYAIRDRLTGLRHLYLGNMGYDETEISWIEHTGSETFAVSDFLDAFPALETFKVRGTIGFKRVRHEALRTLIIENGGLPATALRQIAESDFSNLEHLEIWTGSGAYDGDGTLDDVWPILLGVALPKVAYLGLRNCEFANDIAMAIGQAPILAQLETLDLSLGNLDNRGADALLQADAFKHLKLLDLHHHFVDEDRLPALQKLAAHVNVDNRQDPMDDPDEPGWCAVGE